MSEILLEAKGLTKEFTLKNRKKVTRRFRRVT